MGKQAWYKHFKLQVMWTGRGVPKTRAPAEHKGYSGARQQGKYLLLQEGVQAQGLGANAQRAGSSLRLLCLMNVICPSLFFLNKKTRLIVYYTLERDIEGAENSAVHRGYGTFIYTLDTLYNTGRHEHPWGIKAEETREVFILRTWTLPWGLTGYRLTLRGAVTG